MCAPGSKTTHPNTHCNMLIMHERMADCQNLLGGKASINICILARYSNLPGDISGTTRAVRGAATCPRQSLGIRAWHI